jgi:hypothetical protein
VRPYHGQTLTEMSDAILGARAVPPSRIERSVPRELEQLVARAMARDLNQRYRNASELYADLRALQAHLPEGPTARIAVPDFAAREHTLMSPPATPFQGQGRETLRIPTPRPLPEGATQPTRRISRVTGRPE